MKTYCRNAGEQHRVEGQRTDRAFLGLTAKTAMAPAAIAISASMPADATTMRRHFEGNAAEADAVHVWNRQEHEEHHADLVYLAAEELRGVGVRELVDGLQHRKDHQDQDQVVDRQDAGDDIVGERLPVHPDLQHEPAHEHDPGEGADRAEQRTHYRRRRGEEPVRIEQRQSQEKEGSVPSDGGFAGHAFPRAPVNSSASTARSARSMSFR